MIFYTIKTIIYYIKTIMLALLLAIYFAVAG